LTVRNTVRLSTLRRTLAVTAAALALPATAVAALPTVDYTLTGPAGQNGWYVGPVTVHWTSDAPIVPCPVAETLSEDTTGVQRSCTASNDDGSVTVTTKVIKIDKTPPTAVVATPQRPADRGVFYTAPLALTWSGADATSGIAECTTTTYAGPDTRSAAPAGTCRDRAGNVSAPVPLPFAYDATAPALTDVAATVGADRVATLRWTPGPDATTVTVTVARGATALLSAVPATTRTLADGPLAPGTTTTYAVTVADAAGNATTATTTATVPPAAATSATANGKPKAKAKAQRPTLRWKAQSRAKYYNLQLFRNGRKILSAWPKSNHYTLKATWRYRGKTYQLTAGRYRWYVWPGYGRRAAHRYGRLHAKGALTYPAPPIRDGGQ
jgi:hypothetical protein